MKNSERKARIKSLRRSIDRLFLELEPFFLRGKVELSKVEKTVMTDKLVLYELVSREIENLRKRK